MLNVKLAVIALGFLLVGPGIEDSTPKEVKIDNVLKKELNKFLSAFKMGEVPSFKKDEKIGDKALIRFAVWRDYYNHLQENLESDSRSLKAKTVEDIVEKYFGRKVEKHQSVDEFIRYSDGYYQHTQGGDGGDIQFAQVTKLVDIGNNELSVTADVYSIWWEDFSRFDPYGLPSEWRKSLEEDSLPGQVGKVVAMIKKVGDHYILLEYSVSQAK